MSMYKHHVAHKRMCLFLHAVSLTKLFAKFQQKMHSAPLYIANNARFDQHVSTLNAMLMYHC